MVLKLYGVNATIIIVLFVCIVLYCYGVFVFMWFCEVGGRGGVKMGTIGGGGGVVVWWRCGGVLLSWE